MKDRRDHFHYVYSSDLRQRLNIRIGSLEGHIPGKPIEEILSNEINAFVTDRYVYISVELYASGRPYSLPAQSHPIPVPKRNPNSSASQKVKWDEWLTLPVQFCELPRDSVLALRLVEFGTDLCLGSTVCEVFSEIGELLQGSRDLWVWPMVEPDPKYHNSSTSARGQIDKNHQMHRLKPLKDKMNFKENSNIEWLNPLTTKEMSQLSHKESIVGDFMNLVIETESLAFREGQNRSAPSGFHPEKRVLEYACVYMENGADQDVTVTTHHSLRRIPDFIARENIVEEAHLKVVRSIGRSMTENKKPSPSERDRLMKIIQEGLTENDIENGTMVFNYRNFLSSYPNALIPFLTSIRWLDPDEKSTALCALDNWAPIKPEAALGLLGDSLAAKQIEVRKYAVSRLRTAQGEDLELYLLQLVQALKYESQAGDGVSRAQLLQESMIDDSGSLSISHNQVQGGLEQFLLEMAQLDPSIGSFLYWFINVEAQNEANEDFRSLHSYDFNRFLEHFNSSFYKSRREKQRAELLRQEKLITDLINELRACEKYSSRPERLEQFKSRLEDETPREEYGTFSDFKPTMYPLDPRKKIVGINVDKTYLFKSAMMPALIFFKLEGGGEVGVILKVGDDLRQDQLILQMITLMNLLLLEEKLDLKLTPYCTLATSIDAGLMEFVPDSKGIGDILRKEGSIGKYLQECRGPRSVIMDNYVRSCAGYCVVTYILGVGDRHNDNLLITRDGKLFHVDFGFILGRDPKPMQPPLKLSREMVEAMGEEGWKDFRNFSYEAYINLRRHSQFILSLFELMLDAGIPDIAIEPDKTLQKLRERMRLDLNDMDAIKHFQLVTDQAISSVTARISENMHAIKIWTTS